MIHLSSCQRHLRHGLNLTGALLSQLWRDNDQQAKLLWHCLPKNKGDPRNVKNVLGLNVLGLERGAQRLMRGLTK